MGLIDQGMPSQQPDPGMDPGAGAPPAAPAAGGASSAHLTPEAVVAKMQLTPVQKQQLQRIVVAGMKVMFSPQSHGMMIKQLQGPGPLPQKIGEGVAGLLGILMKESQNSLPPNLLIPAAMILCIHVVDYLKQSGQPATDQDLGAAIQVATHALLKVSGVDPDKLTAQAGAAAAPGLAQPQQPAAPDDAEDPADAAAPGEEQE